MGNIDSKSTITKEINDLRKNLLDMGLRNNLLNFRELKRNIRIIDENPSELYQILIFDENLMEFLPKIDKDIDTENDKEYDKSNLDNHLGELENKNDILWSMPINESDIPDKHKDLFLQTNLSEKELQKRLFTVNQNHKTSLEEQGIKLPDFEEFDSKEDIYTYFNEVEKSISSKNDWKINQEIYLSTFNFKKFVMYRDLDLKNWVGDIEDNSIRELFYPTENNDFEPFDENAVDNLIKSSDVFHVVDADSSQIAVLEEAKKGKNFVVEGPPGTGKSQTIVNLIAELNTN